jgi:hypothetical protein
LGKGSPLSGTDPDRFSQVSSHYEFLATTIRMTADTVHIAVAKMAPFASELARLASALHRC